MNTPLPAEQISWTAPAELASVDRICDELSAWLVERELPEHLFPVQLLARESLNNAVLHGSQQNAAMSIRFSVKINDGQIVLEASDEGLGFDWQASLIASPAHSFQTSGRGLWIYHLFADQVDFNPAGNRVRLARNIERNSDPDRQRSDPDETKG